MVAIPRILMIVGVASIANACGRDSRAAMNQRVETTWVSPASAACDHAACGNDFFVDLAPVDGCTVGSRCAVSVKLVATGDYHINDAYPYKFKADEIDGVEFLGAGGPDRNVFSTFTGNWSKSDERTGAMTIAFKPSNPGTMALGGTFKLSVCSPENCQLESQAVKTTVTVR